MEKEFFKSNWKIYDRWYVIHAACSNRGIPDLERVQTNISLETSHPTVRVELFFGYFLVFEKIQP